MSTRRLAAPVAVALALVPGAARAVASVAAAVVAAAAVAALHVLHAQVAPPVRHELRVPDLPGLETLKGDFHLHSVFSDGRVWPTVHVQEAWRDGLDVIAH